MGFQGLLPPVCPSHNSARVLSYQAPSGENCGARDLRQSVSRTRSVERRGGDLVPPVSPCPQAPQVLPDGRLSRVRLATMTLPAQSAQGGGGSRARSHTPRTTRCATPLVSVLPWSTRLRRCVLWWGPSLTVMAESPVTLLRGNLAGVPCLVLWLA